MFGFLGKDVRKVASLAAASCFITGVLMLAGGALAVCSSLWRHFAPYSTTLLTFESWCYTFLGVAIASLIIPGILTLRMAWLTRATARPVSLMLWLLESFFFMGLGAAVPFANLGWTSLQGAASTASLAALALHTVLSFGSVYVALRPESSLPAARSVLHVVVQIGSSLRPPRARHTHRIAA